VTRSRALVSNIYKMLYSPSCCGCTCNCPQCLSTHPSQVDRSSGNRFYPKACVPIKCGAPGLIDLLGLPCVSFASLSQIYKRHILDDLHTVHSSWFLLVSVWVPGLIPVLSYHCTLHRVHNARTWFKVLSR